MPPPIAFRGRRGPKRLARLDVLGLPLWPEPQLQPGDRLNRPHLWRAAIRLGAAVGGGVQPERPTAGYRLIGQRACLR